MESLNEIVVESLIEIVVDGGIGVAVGKRSAAVLVFGQ